MASNFIWNLNNSRMFQNYSKLSTLDGSVEQASPCEQVLWRWAEEIKKKAILRAVSSLKVKRKHLSTFAMQVRRWLENCEIPQPWLLRMQEWFFSSQWRTCLPENARPGDFLQTGTCQAQWQARHPCSIILVVLYQCIIWALKGALLKGREW